MKTKKITKTKTILILTAVIFFGLSFNLLDFDFNNEASAVIYSDKWVMETDLADADASFLGENVWDQSSWCVSNAGDVNNDGFDDFLTSTPWNSEGGNSAGQTYLILGKSSEWQTDVNLSDTDASFIGEAANDCSGEYISSAGDVNNDGYDDFLIGAPYNDEGGNNAGQTYLILGKASADWGIDFNLSNADASFIGSRRISAAGDVNNDGFDDFLMGDLYNDEGGDNTGQTYLILGKASGWQMDVNLSNADASFIGEAVGDCAGSVSSAGDVNNDGFDDFLIGANSNDEGGSNTGQTYLILGKASGWQMDVNLSNADASFIGEAANDWSGWNVSSAGDVNNDGFDDFLINAIMNSEGGHWSGQTYLILGKASGWEMDVNLSNVDASFIGENADDESGMGFSSAGDVNNDGFDDIIIGAPYFKGDWSGRSYLIFGKTSGWQMDTNLSESDASFIAEYCCALSGYHISEAGDVNADGYDDFILDAAGHSQDGKSMVGKTYLILGEPNQCAEESDDCSLMPVCDSPPAAEPLACVDHICRTCVSLICSADGAEDNSVSEMGDAIDDVYCTWNIHDGCLVKEGVETVDGSNNPSYWEGESCDAEPGTSDLWGEKKIYIDDINDYNIKGNVCVDDYNSFWINNVQVNDLENGSAGCTGLQDVSNFFQTGWNTIKFKAVDTCSGNRYMDIDWEVTPRAPALNGNAVSPSKIRLTWDDRGAGVTYNLWNSDSGSYIYNGDQTSFDHTGLDSNTTYSYRITASKNGYTSSWSDSISATTWNNPPIADAGLDQFVVIGSSVNLDGSGSYDETGDDITYRWDYTPPGLVGRWFFDENSGDIAYDSSGVNRNDGTLLNSADIYQHSGISEDEADTNMIERTQGIIGTIGNGLSFDGINDYVNCGQDSSLKITGAITVEAWVNWDGTGNPYFVTKTGNSSRRSYDLSGNSDGTVEFRMGSSNCRSIKSSGTISISKNEWIHLIGTYEPSQYVRLYVNGSLAKENISSVPSSQCDNGLNWYVGAREGNQGWFNGSIDKAKIYNRALSEDEIENLYEYGIGMSCWDYTLSGLVGRWYFNEGSGDIAYDSSGNNNDGTIYGASRIKSEHGKALSFDGINDYVEISHIDDYIMDNGTVEFWFNAREVKSNDVGLFSKDSCHLDTGGHLSCYVTPSSKTQTRLQSTSQSTYIHSSEKINANQWYHMVSTFGDQGMKLYIDGNLSDTDNYTGGTSGNFEPIAIGSGTWHSGGCSAPEQVGVALATEQHYDGIIDEVKIYNRALSEDEIENLYEFGMGTLISDPYSETPIFTPDTIGVYHIDLTVTDSYGGFDVDTVSITVADPPPVPVCGNNMIEGDEECDGTGDALCPGKCIAPGEIRECLCPQSMPKWKETKPKKE